MPNPAAVGLGDAKHLLVRNEEEHYVRGHVVCLHLLCIRHAHDGVPILLAGLLVELFRWCSVPRVSLPRGDVPNGLFGLDLTPVRLGGRDLLVEVHVTCTVRVSE